ncbi:hypothetical protein HHK36_023574 [Tetracentron sinense]|uniref:Uncharacterized protein n=1 Tax=Tetracentron sinense TaxID=13715 RepID=A0A834YMX3_TETSI|nr:hypothetical protein HHK36_023574 [Tetracentron sinense]
MARKGYFLFFSSFSFLSCSSPVLWRLLPSPVAFQFFDGKKSQNEQAIVPNFLSFYCLKIQRPRKNRKSPSWNFSGSVERDQSSLSQVSMSAEISFSDEIEIKPFTGPIELNVADQFSTNKVCYR